MKRESPLVGIMKKSQSPEIASSGPECQLDYGFIATHSPTKISSNLTL